MGAVATGFAAGVWWLQQQPELPRFAFACAMVCSAAGLAWLLRGTSGARRSAVLALCGAFAGYGYASLRADLALRDALDPAIEGRDIRVTGVIDSLPVRFDRGLRFQMAVQDAPAGVPGRLALSWYSGFATEDIDEVPDLQPGQRWRLTVRLKRPHGSANPHGFDYELWLLEQGVRAGGYVRPARQGERLLLDGFVPTASTVVDRARAWLQARILRILDGRQYAGVIVALVVGEQRAIEQSDWKLFNQTGIGHLVSISGLHITMLAGLGSWSVFLLWRRVRVNGAPPGMHVPAQSAAALAGACVALAYCLLAGWGVPAQRTFFMLGVVAVAVWAGRLTAAFQVLALALMAVLALDPWAALAAGFWLSFGAVATIFYVTTGRHETLPGRWAWLREAGRVQWAVTLGLAPMTLLLFQQISVVGPAANAIAIPVVSFLVTPLALAGSVLPDLPPFNWVLLAGHECFAWLMLFIEWLASQPFSTWSAAVPEPFAFGLAMAGVAWCLAPAGVPMRPLGLLLFLPMLTTPVARPVPGGLEVTALDVGQGTAVLVETSHHVLLYDTGPQFSADSDSGSRVIAPYLRARGIDRLDAMVVSHNDADHSGGAISVLKAVGVDVVWSSLSDQHPVRKAARLAVRCAAGQAWEWDGVRFEMLHPVLESYKQDQKPNARSCVLRVGEGEHAVLLTGDIEARQELEMLARSPALVRASVLIVPHHGSMTSSTEAFLDAATPAGSGAVALVQAGYQNRFGHPREAVLQRYRARGLFIERTDESGAISVRLGLGGRPEITRYREQERRYWFGR
jgi:competence protein ComEC